MLDKEEISVAKAIVTGCAGFIGSALSKRLLGEGYDVIGVDCFTNNYNPLLKKKNIEELVKSPHFTLIAKNIIEIDWSTLLSDVAYVFHQAAVPGVRNSWGKNFEEYVRNNIMATQVLLEAAKDCELQKFVFASSSSVYGLTLGNTSETIIPRPISPYGVTKLASEQLCHLYASNYGVPTISLRYFTVYGPGQRPDMAFHKFILSILKNEPILLYGDGLQTRDFTYVEDVVEANLLALNIPGDGGMYNIGGRSPIILLDVIEQIARMTGTEPKMSYIDKQAGDPPHTWANIQKAEQILGYFPKYTLAEGLAHEIDFIRKLYSL